MLKIIKQKFIKISATTISLLVYLMLFFSTARGQDIRDNTNETDNLWGIGTSITYPLAEIYMIQASYSPWEFGDILFGVAYQNWKNDRAVHMPALFCSVTASLYGAAFIQK